jgi:hypothetical protein
MPPPKERVLRGVSQLPDDATFEEILEEVYFLVDLAKALAEADEGTNVPHAEVRRRLAKWLK